METTSPGLCSWNGQWRKPGPHFGGDEKKFAVPPNSEIWGDGEKVTVSWN